MADNTKKKKSPFWVDLLASYSTILIMFYFMNPFNNYRRYGGSSREKSCYSNIRILQGAVEMYNMDNKVLMDNLEIDILKSGNYIKEKPVSPETSCAYLGNDLSNEGTVYCTYHGDMQGLTAGLYYEKQLKEKEIKERNDKILWTFFLVVMFFIDGVVVFVIRKIT